MKKRTGRLQLHRETLRHLSDSTWLRRVVGATGDTGTDTQGSGNCDQRSGCVCETEGIGCTLPHTAAFGTCNC
jgi:hypothetical protein